MKKELRDIATEASSNLGWWQPWQFAEQVGPKEAAFIAAMSPQIAIELLDENESMRSEIDNLLEVLTRLLSMCERQSDFNDDGDGAMFDKARAAIAKATGATT